MAIDVSRLTTVPVPDLTLPLVLGAAVLVALAGVLLALAFSLGRHRRAFRKTRRVGVHAQSGGTSIWHAHIDAVVDDYREGACGRQEALMRLAALTRAFATRTLGRDMRAKTLADLAREPRDGSQAAAPDLLRQTVAALYPPEFADAAVNLQARDTSIEEAADWVHKLVERWR